MRDIAVIDCETDPFRKGRIPQPFLWGYYNGSEYRQFVSGHELAEFIGSRDEIIYAHNGGKFDFHYLLPHLSAFDELTIINGRLARCCIGLAELRDSYCIIPEPLSKYKKDEIDYAIMERESRSNRANREKIERYLKSDCVYLWEMVCGFVRKFGPELTQAGAAMKQWRKMSNDNPEETDEQFYEDLSPFYFGGRVECFRGGVIDTDFSVYDINSAYPRAMLEKHPYSRNYERARGFLRGADFMRVRCSSYGAFPFRGEGGGDGIASGLRFPDDGRERDFCVSRWELDAAEDTGTLKRARVLESVRFMRHTDFAPYIDRFWKEREAAKKAGDVLGALFAKLMMNSLYGKFAANPENYQNYMIVEPKYAAELAQGVPLKKGKSITSDYKMAAWKFGGELGPWLLAQRDLDEFQRRYYNVATGASITGYVRAMLWRAIQSSEGVLYCDTDSIAVERKGAAVALGDKLGQWKHEGDFDRAGIAGKKLYIFRGKPDSKGHREYKTASKGARLTHAQLWKVACGGVVDYKAEVPTYSVNKPPTFTNRTIVNTVRH